MLKIGSFAAANGEVVRRDSAEHLISVSKLLRTVASALAGAAVFGSLTFLGAATAQTSVNVVPPNLSGSVAGSLPGEAGVSPSGSSTYSVALAVPPGTAGLVPSIGLNYDSHAGTGHLGQGWSLGGLASITRCPTTIAQDGVRGAVTLTATDQFCLDGQRLLLVSGTHGASAEYRTQVDTFSKVVSTGSNTAKGPDYWKVFTKSGLILTFGGTTDSTIEPQGKPAVVRTWAVSRVEDRRGNYYDVKYLEDTTNGEYVPTQIRYTGNSVSGLVPYNAVNFSYETRPDTSTAYIAGSMLRNTKRLTAIRTYVNTATDGSGGTLVRDYRIGYIVSTASGHSLVDNIALCDGSGSCLPPTVFSWTQKDAASNTFVGSGYWGGPAVTFQTATSTNKVGTKAQQVQTQVLMGDFNGDGKTDLISSDGSGNWKVCVSTGAAFNCAMWAGPTVKTEKAIVGDFNGDGRTDLAVPNVDGSGSWSMCLSTGSGFSCSTWAGRNLGQNVNAYFVGDFDGDGRDDIIGADIFGGGDFICRSLGNSFLGNCTAYSGAGTYLADITPDPDIKYRTLRMVGDFNGDGRTDYLDLRSIGTSNNFWSVSTAKETSLTEGVMSAIATGTVTQLTASLPGQSRVADQNGDSYSDFVGTFNSSPATASICQSTGVSLACSALTGFAYAASGQFGDSDGDGRPDLFIGGQLCQIDDRGLFNCATWTSTGTATPGYVTGFVGDFNGDGRVDRAYYVESTGSWFVSLAAPSLSADLLSSVTNGVGHPTQFSYKGLHDPSVYTKGGDVSYPKRNLTPSSPEVSQIRIGNALGGWLTTDFSYKGLRADLQGRGMLGFESVTSIDRVNNITTVTNYSQDFPTIGMSVSSSATQANGTVLSTTSNTLASMSTTAGAVFPYVQGSTTTTRDLNNALISTVSNTINAGGLDAYGNALNTTSSITADGDTFTTTTVNTYDNLTSNWLIGLLRTSSVTKTAPSVSSVTRSVSIDYNTPTYNDVLRETVEPNDATLTLKLTTEYARDPNYGVVTSRTLKGRDPASNTDQTRVDATMSYDAKARFVVVSTNAKSQSETRYIDDAYGNLVGLTGPNGITTGWIYDGWGRKILENRANGTGTTYAYRNCVDDCLDGAVTVTIEQNWSGGSQTTVPTETFSDQLGRTVLTRSWAFNGTPVHTRQVFNASGRPAYSAPTHFANATPMWTYFGTDDLGRVNAVSSPNAAGGYDLSGTTYNGLSVTTTNANNQTRTELRNGLGKLKRVTDHYNYLTSYLYDPFGNLVQTTDDKGNQIKVSYDKLGRKTQLQDPDLGTWTYSIDPLGQTWKQVDAKNQTTTYTFDELGRMTRRLEADMDANWVYDTAPKGIGKLAEAYTWAGGVKDYDRLYTYDAVGRPAAVITRLDADYVEEYGYDGFGRQNWTNYWRNAVGTSGGPMNAVYSLYNENGFPSYVGRYNDGATSPVLYIIARDAQGRITKQQLANGIKTDRSYNERTGRLETIVSGPDNGAGNATASHQNDSYQYDSLGNLMSRTQLVATSGALFQETFSYDMLNRLKTSTIGSTVKSYSYDSIGNLSGKTDVGVYSYPVSGATSVRPHAVSSISGTVAGVTNPSFVYDNNGNLQSGLGRSYAWTSYNQAKDIDKMSGATAVQRTSFLFGPEHQRVKQTVSPMSGGVPGAPTTTIYYAGTMEREIDTSANTTTVRTYLPMGLGYVEEKMSGTGLAVTASGSRNPKYFLNDRLGSPVAVMDSTQAVLQRFSYDPWGRRRNADGSDDSAGSLGTIKDLQDHTGYTGHEQLDQLGLVHMGGRIYDPIVGRFTSPDPTITSPSDLQSLNRFSYVLNNPFAYIDPTGFTEATQDDTQVNQVHESGASEQGWTGGVVTAQYEKCSGAGRLCSVYRPNGVISYGNAALVDTRVKAKAYGEFAPEDDVNSSRFGPTGLLEAWGFDAKPQATLPTVYLNVTRAVPPAAAAGSPGGPDTLQSDAIDELDDRVLRPLNDFLMSMGPPGAEMSLPLKGASFMIAATRLQRVARGAEGLADLAKLRGGLGLKVGEGTLAKLEVGGKEFYGINAHGQPTTMKVNAITRTHAEADAFQQALNAGVKGGDATLYVDRALCTACGQNGGVSSMARQLELNQVTVITPQGTQIIRP